ncbi:hypothetical protein DYB32_010141 [Aphanomyces invadans]|uniref:HTH CENPB-type domain-containing protein n=1 Tax=Aphanomyces invadans TaxID=157072 RepID=A0A3R6V372_9STRA|nr:hypothetical protein DYB32_010141 [Aphanomyces invadans]
MEEDGLAQVQSRQRGRPVSKYGPKKKPKQFKNSVVTYSERLTLIKYYKSFGMSATLVAFHPHLNTVARESVRKKIFTWVKNRDFIQKMASSPGTTNISCWRPLGAGTTLSADTEEHLVRWVLDMSKDGVPVTNNMLKIMALEVAIDSGLQDHEFLAGWHRVHGFKRQHGLSMRARTRIGQDTPEDGVETLNGFASRIRCILADHNIERIYNADQTGVNYEYLPTKTLNPTGDRTISIKCGGKTKERVTAMLLADSTGAKHPLFLVLRPPQTRSSEVYRSNCSRRRARPLWVRLRKDLPTTTIVNGFKKCQHVDGPSTLAEESCEVLDDDVLVELFATCAVEDTMDPGNDIGNTGDEDEDAGLD